MKSKLWRAFWGIKGRTVQLTYLIRTTLLLLLLLTFILLFSSLLQLYSSHKFYKHVSFPNKSHAISSPSYWWYQVKTAMPRLRRLAAGLSQQRPGFTHSPVQSSPCLICGAMCGTWIFFSPSTSVFPRQNHPTNAPLTLYKVSNWYRR